MIELGCRQLVSFRSHKWRPQTEQSDVALLVEKIAGEQW